MNVEIIYFKIWDVSSFEGVRFPIMEAQLRFGSCTFTTFVPIVVCFVGVWLVSLAGVDFVGVWSCVYNYPVRFGSCNNRALMSET